MSRNDHRIIFHADDYGACREVSEHILDCFHCGALNSLSILPNGNDLKEALMLLSPMQNKIKVSIHFNLAEGHCMAKPSQVPLLVDERGMFNISFFKTLVWSFTIKRSELRRQLKQEMRAQLEQMLPYVNSVRIDSHQHYHMIPIVLESILEVVKDSGREIEFVRVPAESFVPFLKHPELWHTIHPINLIKNVVLNVLNIVDTRLLKPYRKKSAVFFGILFSGRMDLKRVSKLIPEFCKIAEKKNLPLEILCHPGGTRRPELLMDIKNQNCVRFYTSEERAIEKEMLMGVVH